MNQTRIILSSLRGGIYFSQCIHNPYSMPLLSRCSTAYFTSSSTSSTLSTSPTTTSPISLTAKSSAFTGKADYYEALFFLQDVLKRAQSVTKPISPRTPIPWYSQDALADQLGFALNRLEYRKIRQSLNALASFLHVKEVAYFLQTFSPVNFTISEHSIDENKGQFASYEKLTNSSTTTNLVIPGNRRPQLGRIDDQGRAISVGRRKSASARAVLSPQGTGRCWINGKPAIEYFSRPNEMFRLAEPWVASGLLGRFDAWCGVKGGGMTGQVGALVNALAKATLLLAPGARMALRSMLNRDPRVVERKKPGQPKARKKFTWVKR